MKCDRCDNEATVHETLKNVNGVREERHLCEECARQLGIASQPVLQVKDLIQKVVQGAAAAQAAGKVRAQTLSCLTCGMTFTEFRTGGLLGCPECYKAFAAPLGPLLERAHEGGTHHAGKVPRRAGSIAGTAHPVPNLAEERARRINQLRKQLDEAVTAEKYELAARLRDDLRRLSEPPGPGLA